MLNGLGYIVTEAWPIKSSNFNTKLYFFKDFLIFHPNQEDYGFDCYNPKEAS
jgi:hypothetical protein